MPWKRIARHQERLGEVRLADYDPVVTYRMAMGQEATANDYLRTLQTCETLRIRAQRALHDVDAFLAPTTMVPPYPWWRSMPRSRATTIGTRAIPATLGWGMARALLPDRAVRLD